MVRFIGLVALVGFSAFAETEDPFSPLLPIKSAPPEIQAAAKAVVRIGTGLAHGTGFFIENGRLITNAHVVGPEDCTFEGCYLTIDFDFQHDSKSETKTLFAVPLYTDPHQDISVLSMYVPTKTNPLDKPFKPTHTLKFAEDKPEPGALLTILGHPFSGLKRWSTAPAYHQTGDWCKSGHCCPPGNSGSPVLNSKAEIAGIVHRSTDMGTEITNLNGSRHVAYFSLASSIRGYLEDDWDAAPSPTLDQFESIPLNGVIEVSLDEDFAVPTMTQFVTRRLFKLEFGVGDEKEEIDFSELLQRVCEEEVMLVETSEDPDYTYDHCSLARDYFNCQGQEIEGGFCPKGKERRIWQKLFRDIALYRELKNGNDFIDWLLAAEMDFVPSKEEAYKAGAAILEEQLKLHPEVPPLSIAYYVATIASKPEEMEFQGKDYVELIRNYRTDPFHFPAFEELGASAQLLAVNKTAPTETLREIYKTLLSDPNLPAYFRAEFEAAAYENDLL